MYAYLCCVSIQHLNYTMDTVCINSGIVAAPARNCTWPTSSFRTSNTAWMLLCAKTRVCRHIKCPSLPAKCAVCSTGSSKWEVNFSTVVWKHHWSKYDIHKHTDVHQLWAHPIIHRGLKAHTMYSRYAVLCTCHYAQDIRIQSQSSPSALRLDFDCNTYTPWHSRNKI